MLFDKKTYIIIEKFYPCSNNRLLDKIVIDQKIFVWNFFYDYGSKKDSKYINFFLLNFLKKQDWNSKSRKFLLKQEKSPPCQWHIQGGGGPGLPPKLPKVKIFPCIPPLMILAQNPKNFFRAYRRGNNAIFHYFSSIFDDF